MGSPGGGIVPRVVRRYVLTVAWALAGYMLAVMVSFTVVSMAFGSATNVSPNRVARDRWAFIAAVIGLVGGGILGWWRNGTAARAPVEAGRQAESSPDTDRRGRSSGDD